MKSLVLLLVLSVGASSGAGLSRAVWQFRSMIKCTMPDSYPLLQLADYGCYCGLGGGGTPVDDLDRCCQAHDACYTEAKKLESCRFLLDNPYTNSYSFSCSSGEITCKSSNDECEMFICNCDRTAAICFAGQTYYPEHHGLDTNTYCS
ncbi:phospholipase A2 [Strigops habroptila]|uniref:Phospholipase A2 n=1 Tax=Strigops habroptila TaxID=2489341 RepID=A0A672UFV1_STRHB|nr:phospholipase A2 [Strigops habroptila]